MPDSDGIAATRLITADPELGGVHVLVLTTFDHDEHVIDDMRAVLRECHRVLKPGGVLLATRPSASRVCLDLEGAAIAPDAAALAPLLGEAAAPEAAVVRIGHENPVEGLAGTSVVTVGYGGRDQALAQLGVVGPTRMDYAGTIASARAVARYLGRTLGEQ